jgi:hypothetical protein
MIEVFLTNVPLLTWSPTFVLFGTAVIGLFLLNFRGNRAAALTALKDSAVSDVFKRLLGPVVPDSSFSYNLNPREKVL